MSTVVIGGGIAGVSCAYHLANAGVADVVLVEKGELTSGSTHHAAGLVTQFNPSPTMMRFRRYSVELYRELGVFETVGIRNTPGTTSAKVSTGTKFAAQALPDEKAWGSAPWK